MKKKLMTLGFCLLSPMFAHAGCEDFMQTWMSTLHPGRTLDADRAACKTWPANPALTLAALALPRDGEEGVMDLDVLVANTDSGEIVAHALQPLPVVENSLRFSDIAIDTASYPLTPTDLAFGVRVSRESTSRAAPAGSTSLSLFVLNGQDLRNVFDQLVVATASGEWDGHCAGHYESTKRDIDLVPAYPDGYSALKVSENAVHSVTQMVEGDCKAEDSSSARTSLTLDYRDGKYSVPKGMSYTD